MNTTRAVTQHRKSPWARALTLLLLLALIATACGSDGLENTSDTADDAESAEAAAEGDTAVDVTLAFADCLALSWNFDEGGPAYFDSVTGLEANPLQSASTSSVPGEVNGGVLIDGGLVAQGNAGIGTGDFAIEAWVNHGGGEFEIASSRVAGGRGFLFEVLTGGRLLLQLNDGGMHRNVLSTSMAPANVWSKVSVSVDRDDQVRFEIDGVDAGSSPVPAQWSGADIDTGLIHFGHDLVDKSARPGQLDELRLYAPCPTEAPSCISPPTGLVAWWPFDEVDPGTGSAPELEISGFSPNPRSDATLINAGLVPSNFGTAADFTGTGTFASAAVSNGALDLGENSDFTADAWIRISETGLEERKEALESLPVDFLRRLEASEDGAVDLAGAIERGAADYSARRDATRDADPAASDGAGSWLEDGYVIVEKGLTTTDGWAFYLTPENELGFMSGGSSLGGAQNSLYSVDDIANLLDGNWHFVSVAIDRDDVDSGYFFVDGQRLNNNAFAAADKSTLTNSSDVTIGALAGTNGYFDEFPGEVDEVEIFNRFLSDTELAAIFESPDGKCKEFPQDPRPQCLDIDVSLSWANQSALRADYDLVVTSPDGTRYLGTPTPVWQQGAMSFEENVEVVNGTSGTWRVEVVNHVNFDSNGYSLTVGGSASLQESVATGPLFDWDVKNSDQYSFECPTTTATNTCSVTPTALAGETVKPSASAVVNWEYGDGAVTLGVSVGGRDYQQPGSYTVWATFPDGERISCGTVVVACSAEFVSRVPHRDWDGDGIQNGDDENPCTPDDPYPIEQLIATDPLGDIDGDGYPNQLEADIGFLDPCAPNDCNPELAQQYANLDFDGDGIPNSRDQNPCEPDEPCPVERLLAGDPLGDFDGDGIRNQDDPNPCAPDRCSFELATAHPNLDFDGDGIPNSRDENPCEPDEQRSCTDEVAVTDPAGDADGDYIPNALELQLKDWGYDPCSPNECDPDMVLELDPRGDWDGDGVMNQVEVLELGTNPCDPTDP